jgi:hypothetical protein
LERSPPSIRVVEGYKEKDDIRKLATTALSICKIVQARAKVPEFRSG